MSRSKEEELALQKTIEFYNLDHPLTKEQRLELSKFYDNIWKTNILFLYLGFIPGLAIPFITKYRQTGSLKGVNFFWASFLGFTGMSIVPQICSPIHFRSKFEQLQQEKGKDSRQVKIVETLPVFLSIKWADYYKTSAEDPNKALKDPREILKNDLKQQQQRAGFLSSGDLLGIKQGTTYGGVAKENKEHVTHSWEDVRRHSIGLPPQGQQPQQATNDDVFVNDDAIFNDDAPVDSQLSNQSQTSSWDKIRRGSISDTGNLIGKVIEPPNGKFNDDDDDWEKLKAQEEFEKLVDNERNATD